jgi:hypothetical protein
MYDSARSWAAWRLLSRVLVTVDATYVSQAQQQAVGAVYLGP